jgi:predicted dehydrogenase
MRVGIAGVGSMGTTHAAGWAETDAELVGFTAEPANEAATLARQYGVRVFPNFSALLSEVDVIDICTPTHLHYSQALEAAAAGKHIVCEKPLARTTSQALEIVQACRRAGVKLLVAQVVRFFPEYAQARAAVAAGQIGRVGVLRLQRGSYRPKKPAGNWFLDEVKSGGILMDLMIHEFDYARWVAGEVESVYAKKVTSGHPDSPVDFGLAILRHRNGALTHIASAWAYPPPTFRTGLEIFGDAGLIQFDSADTSPILNLIQKKGADSPDVALPSSPVTESPYTTEIKEFYAALSGEASARVTPEDGLAAVQVAEAAIESSQSGLAVRLAPVEEAAR